MINKVNVLIFPAGSVNAIEIYDSLKFNIHFKVFGATSVNDHAEFVYKKDNLIIDKLYITDEDFIPKFNRILKKYSITYVIPTHDVIASFLTNNNDKICSKIVCSPYETARIAENKYLMYRKLSEYDFCPRIYQSTKDIDRYPVFIKPCIGAGGKGTSIANDIKDVEQALSGNIDMIISEHLPGKEYTVDCFTNQHRELLFIGPRTRENIIQGVSFHSERMECNKEIRNIAHTLNEKFVFRGGWFFQIKEDSLGRYKLMEFSVRQAGTMALYRQLGVNFATLSLFDAMGYDVKILFNDYKVILDRFIKPKFHFEYSYTKMYVDFDDTLIVDGKVNTILMRLIYQCINSNVQVILLTKHAYNLEETLKKHRINRDLFDDIILIDAKLNKCDYIVNRNAIFIENYFPERMMVKEKCNIPVFDVDAVEGLIDSSKL